MNKIGVSCATGLVVALFIVIADYYALLGTTTRIEMDYAEIIAEARDAETGAPIYDVHVRCWKKGADDICAERNAERRDRVSVFIPLNKQVVESRWFVQSEKPVFPQNTQFHFMLIHHDYDNPIKTLDIKDIYAKRGQLITVMMNPRPW